MKTPKTLLNVTYLKSIAGYGLAVGFSISLLFFVIAGSWIGNEVKSQCLPAQKAYGGDCVEALMARLEDDTQSNRTRNSAIWALGQLGDRRALPVLERFYTGQIPDREPLDQVISQYELRKAIQLTQGGPNMTAFLWRSRRLTE